MWQIEVHDPKQEFANDGQEWSVARRDMSEEDVERLREANLADGGVEEETFRFREMP